MLSAASSFSASNASSLFSNPLEGMQRGFKQAADASAKIADGDVSPENMVSMIQAEVLVKANAVVARTADKLLGAFLDTKV
jgi:hypothetical protein